MSRHVRVLHIFESACNLINEDGLIVSPVSPQTGDGPFNIVVPGVRFDRYLTPANPVTCTLTSLTIGDLTIHTSSARLWNPRPCWETLHKNLGLLYGPHPQPLSLRERGVTQARGELSPLSLLLDVLRDQAPAGSLAGLIAPPTGPTSILDTAVLSAARWPANQIITGLCQDDRAQCLEGVASLAGLGGGLTPAGDDWLVGCMLGIWAATPFRRAISPADIAQTAAPRTTPLSAAWLHAAARGECGSPWHALFDSLVKGGEPGIRQAAEGVIHQGHTSGADALAGFVAVLCEK